MDITLPCGFAADGSWFREARLHPISGHDEVFLIEETASLTPASRTTALLARVLERLGPLTPVTQESIRALTVGDRDALLLHLRRITVGERISFVITCPASGCGEKMDLDLNIGDLLTPPYALQNQFQHVVMETEGASYLVRFRLPTGEDQEAAANLSTRDFEGAINLVLERCVADVVDSHTGPAKNLPKVVRDRLPGLMCELDPQAELELKMECPVCRHPFEFVLDPIDCFFKEISLMGKKLYREVHWLACNYHWSESEILGLTRQKRMLYLDLLATAGQP